MICEGCSDTAAALDLGFAAIGLASAGNTFDRAAEYVDRHRIAHVVIVADLDRTVAPNGDVDFPGIVSALKLAAKINLQRLQFCLPPVKDLRQWSQTAKPDDIRQAIGDAPRVTDAWLNRAWHSVEHNRQQSTATRGGREN